MEQDRYSGSGPDPGLSGCDRDLFKRVWRRVMPEEGDGCPIELNDEQETSLAVSNSSPNSFALPVADGAEYAGETSISCLGANSAVYSEQLQNFIRGELSDWRYYRILAGCAGMDASRVLSNIASDEYWHAKRLSTAYFLISGVRFWPVITSRPSTDGYLGALRRRFSAEQRGEADYVAAAAETNDPCLHELYLELAQDEANHARIIRQILEQM